MRHKNCLLCQSGATNATCLQQMWLLILVGIFDIVVVVLMTDVQVGQRDISHVADCFCHSYVGCHFVARQSLEYKCEQVIMYCFINGNCCCMHHGCNSFWLALELLLLMAFVINVNNVVSVMRLPLLIYATRCRRRSFKILIDNVTQMAQFDFTLD